jgi:hypothetical protein
LKATIYRVDMRWARELALNLAALHAH